MTIRSINILLIEDVYADRRLIQEMLAEGSTRPYSLQHANDLSAGIEMLLNGSVDLVLLDLTLPDSKGLDTLDAVYSRRSEVPIVVLTGLEDETLGAEAVRRGAQDYLLKSEVGGELLWRVIRYAIERKRMEEELRELYEAEKDERHNLEEEAKSRGQFINVLGHELRTPLNPALMSARMLRDALSQTRGGSELRLAEIIQKSLETLASRLDDLRDLARFSRGRFRLEIQPLEPRSFLEEVVSRFQPSVEGKRQRIIAHLPSTLPMIKADRSRLEQTLTNLLANASKFSPEDREIILRARDSGEGIVVEVEDKGIGLSQEQQRRVFEPYHRVEQDRQAFPGLGLGLSIAKQIIEAHGGSMWVDSDLGRGSKFAFSLPLECIPQGENAKMGNGGVR